MTNQMETVSDFKARIALIMRNAKQTGKKWSLVGAPLTHESLLRKPTDRGYYPPSRPTRKNTSICK
jgi:hypothetical protein